MSQTSFLDSSSIISDEKVLIVIPARLASQRLPNKPLVDIKGIPMIVRVWQQAVKANVGPVIVACCGPEIREAIEAAGGIAIETDPELPSGSDRVMAAIQQFDPQNAYKIIINLQGDLPTIQPLDIQKSLVPLRNPLVDIGSLCAPITEAADIHNPNVVKIAAGAWQTNDICSTSRAVYFSRQAVPANADIYYVHVGIYAYRRPILEAFMALPPSYLEITEKLENLRALEAGMRIDVALLDEIPQSVDTQEDLSKAAAQLS